MYQCSERNIILPVLLPRFLRHPATRVALELQQPKSPPDKESFDGYLLLMKKIKQQMSDLCSVFTNHIETEARGL